jgi:hypothetical protein
MGRSTHETAKFAIPGLAGARSPEATAPTMPKKPAFAIEWKISLGAILQIAGLLVSGIYYVARVEGNMTQTRSTLEEMRSRQERIEKYLSSKDPNYWRVVGDLRTEEQK